MSGGSGNEASLWRLPARDLSLGAGEIHVWRAALDRPLAESERLGTSLSEDEQARAARLRRPQDRDSFIVARGVLRSILGRYLGMPPSSLVFAYGAQGKPSLAAPRAEAIHFNLSHSRGWALYAFACDHELGIDIEFMRDGVEIEKLAQRFFAPGEVSALTALPPPLRRHGFFLCWSRKEAFVKARGEGLTMPLDAFEVALAPGAPAALLSVRADQKEADRWTLHDLAVAKDYAAALAVQDSASSLLLWHWPGLCADNEKSSADNENQLR